MRKARHWSLGRSTALVSLFLCVLLGQTRLVMLPLQLLSTQWTHFFGTRMELATISSTPVVLDDTKSLSPSVGPEKGETSLVPTQNKVLAQPPATASLSNSVEKTAQQPKQQEEVIVQDSPAYDNTVNTTRSSNATASNTELSPTSTTNTTTKTKTTPFRILRTAQQKEIDLQVSNGAYKVRCLDFQAWAHQCTNHQVEVVAESIERAQRQWKRDKDDHRRVPFNATIICKAVLPQQSFMGPRIVVDVVDTAALQRRIPPHYHAILQNDAHAQVFQNAHTPHTYVVEHSYTLCDACTIKPKVTTHPQPLRAFSIMTKHPNCYPDGVIPPIPGVEMIHIREKDTPIPQAFAQVLQMVQPQVDNATAAAAYQETLQKGGMGLVYAQMFQSFDVLVVFMKGGANKRLFGSVQRIVNQMRSGVPVLVEARGIFETFVWEQDYPCYFYNNEDLAARRRNVNSTNTMNDHQQQQSWSFVEAMERLRDDHDLRKTCRQKGLEITQEFTPRKIGTAMLKAVGYDTERPGAITC